MLFFTAALLFHASRHKSGSGASMFTVFFDITAFPGLNYLRPPLCSTAMRRLVRLQRLYSSLWGSVHGQCNTRSTYARSASLPHPLYSLLPPTRAHSSLHSA